MQRDAHLNNAALMARRRAALPSGLGQSFDIVCERAENAEIWDVEGRRYIDFAGGIAVLNTGHRHPKVIAAVQGAARQAFTTPASRCWPTSPTSSSPSG